MDCKKVESLLADRSVGLLKGAVLSEVDRHLATCESCRSEQARLTEVMNLVESLPEKEPPYGLWYGVEQRITQESSRTSNKWVRLSRRLTLGAMGALATITIFLGTWSHLGNSPTPVALQDNHTRIIQYASVGAEEPFADRVSLGSLAGVASDEEPVTEE